MNPVDLTHHDGVPWWDAPLPPSSHQCSVQTQGWLDYRLVQRCACGAIRLQRESDRPDGGWIERSSREAKP